MIITVKQMRPRDRVDHYPTPAAHVAGALDLLPERLAPSLIVDPGAGSGAWGLEARARWPGATIAGIEPNHLEPRPPSYDHWSAAPFADAAILAYIGEADLVCGNPPYFDAEAMIRQGLAILGRGRYLVFLLRLAFLEGQARAVGLWRDYPPAVVGVYGRRPSFTGNGRTDATAYAVFVWRQGYRGDPIIRWIADATPRAPAGASAGAAGPPAAQTGLGLEDDADGAALGRA